MFDKSGLPVETPLRLLSIPALTFILPLTSDEIAPYRPGAPVPTLGSPPARPAGHRHTGHCADPAGTLYQPYETHQAQRAQRVQLGGLYEVVDEACAPVTLCWRSHSTKPRELPSKAKGPRCSPA